MLVLCVGATCMTSASNSLWQPGFYKKGSIHAPCFLALLLTPRAVPGRHFATSTVSEEQASLPGKRVPDRVRYGIVDVSYDRTITLIGIGLQVFCTQPASCQTCGRVTGGGVFIAHSELHLGTIREASLTDVLHVLGTTVIGGHLGFALFQVSLVYTGGVRGKGGRCQDCC